MWAGSGDDSITGGNGVNEVYGGAGADSIQGNNGDDRIFGNAGADIIHSGGHADYADGGPGDDILIGAGGEDTLFGGEGNDLLRGLDGNDSLSGDDGRDLVVGGKQTDSIDGGEGEDILVSGSIRLTDLGLLPVLAEWSSARTLEQRVANLRDGSGTDERENGETFLVARRWFRSHGGNADSLIGGAASDWFFAHAADTTDRIAEDLFDELV